MRASTVLIILFAIAGPIGENSKADDNASPDRGDELPIRTWTSVFVDADTKKPLAGISVDTNISVSNETELQDRLLTSDKAGEIKIPLREGRCTSLNIRGPGWCYASGFPIVGDLPAEWRDKDTPPSNPDKPIVLKLFRGTEIRGRLLLPGTPASNVSLIAGVHSLQEPWVSQQYIDNMSHSFSVSEWPNWSSHTTTAEDGTFSITVPPKDARGWVRIGTTRGGFNAIDTTILEKTNRDYALVRYAPFTLEINGDDDLPRVDESSGIVELGDLTLARGIVLRGRVVDAEDRPLAGIHLFTSGVHGPLAGRKTVSQADGTFEFMPMNPGTFRLTPDAHFCDEKGQTNSRDVQAAFVSQDVTLHEGTDSQEIVVRALPHVELAFEWRDRRAKKGAVSYYGGFRLTGAVPQENGAKAWWTAETVKVERGGKEFLIVKVPKSINGLKIALHPDQKVTPSYHDSTVRMATGQVALGNPERELHRVIFADEPQSKR